MTKSERLNNLYKKCRVCLVEKLEDMFYKHRRECKSCHNEARKKREKKHGYFVYYLPHENYCGVTNRLRTRINRHKIENKNIDDWIVLYHSNDAAEAAHHEAMFQSVLGMNGLNYKK